MNFDVRSEAQEIMDDLDCSGPVVAQTLRELEFINKWLGGNMVTLDAVGTLVKQSNLNRVHILDTGCGSGDMLMILKRWGAAKKLQLALHGVDANPNIIDLARLHCREFRDIQFTAVDIFSPAFNSLQTDILIGTLFFHHFTSEQLVTFFSRLRSQVRIGFIINDIHRHMLAYYSIKWLTQLFSKSDMVKNDAPVSVLRGFTRREITGILERAGYTNYSINWKWAFRWQVIVRI